MNGRWVFFVVLPLIWAVSANWVRGAIDTSRIDEVRNKEVLSSTDLLVIDRFVNDIIQELVRTEDFTSVAVIRAALLARVSSNRRSAQVQYAEQLSGSAYEHVSQAFRELSGSPPQNREFRVMVNLLILMDGLEDPRLADLALKMLKDENAVIRYWAVHSLTNPGITKQLNSGKSTPQLALRIVNELKGLVDSCAPETLTLVADFATEVNVPQGQDLLLEIASTRMKKYENWAAEYELVDGIVLKSLCKKISSAGRDKQAVARSFGQLYSYVIQRYIKGQNSLSTTQKHQLVSVLVETEKMCVSTLLGMPQSSIVGIRKAIENKDYRSLLREHDRLLGSGTRPGLLQSKLKFDYLNPDGTKRAGPLALGKPPITKPRK
ncbi:MAG: hypothetical protein ACYSX1_04445 [Planctomycetota bacterium]|jgi:hypothetical protein